MALRPSPFAAGLVGTAGFATLVLVAWMPTEPWWRLLAAAFISGTWWDALRTIALRRGTRATLELAIRGESVAVRDGTGRWREGRLAHPCFVAPWLTIVRWRPHGSRFDRTIPLLPDMLDPEPRRRLRVLLRWR